AFRFGDDLMTTFAFNGTRLGLGAAAVLAGEPMEEPKCHGDEPQHQDDRGTGFALPVRENNLGGWSRGDDKRQLAELAVDEDSLTAVDLTGGLEAAGRRGAEMVETRHDTRLGRIDIRLAHQHEAVGADQRERSLRAEIDAVEEPLEKIELHGAENDAGEAAVAMRDASAESDSPDAADLQAERRADIEADIRIVSVHGEEIAVGEIHTL